MNLSKLLLVYLFLVSTAFAGLDPSNKLKLGDGTASDKTIEFNKGSATNPKLMFKNSDSSFQLNQNILRFGAGAAADKTVEADQGLGATNPKLKYNNSSSKWQFSNDGSTYSDIGSGGGTGPRGYVQVSSSNGYGSTNTKVPRYSNVDVNVGTSITYADSATLGNSFTINTTGIYCAAVTCSASSAETACGWTKNESGVGTTIIYNINAPTRLTHMFENISGTTVGGSASWCGFVTAGDVLRVHGNGNATGQASYDQASIVQVSN